MTDEELVQRMKMGDQAAFEALIHRYHAPLYGYLQRMLRDPRKAEDITQETFLRLIRHLKTKEVPDKIRAWLYKVATNLCRDYWRSASFRTEDPLPQTFEQKDESYSVIEIYEHLETRKEILLALDDLTDSQKQMVILRFYQDLKLQEIAEIMDVSIGTVKGTLFHGLKKLKKALQEKQQSEKWVKGGMR